MDISKMFDKIWHEGLYYKLESLGISGNLLNFVVSFMAPKLSDWAPILAGVPQGSIFRFTMNLVLNL